MWIDRQFPANNLAGRVHSYGSVTRGVSFRYGDVELADYYMVITNIQIWQAPGRSDTPPIEIPGRNGDLVQDGGRFPNVDLKIKVVIPDPCFQFQYEEFVNRVMSMKGYQRILCNLQPDTYRMGKIIQGIEPLVTSNNRGQFEFIVNCKPQKYLKSGDQVSHYEASPAKIVSECWMDALPLIKVYGTGPGHLHIGKYTVDIKALSGHLTLDCELQNAYRQEGTGAPENKNDEIYTRDFPRLSHGENIISWDGGITAVDITPRWWKL